MNNYLETPIIPVTVHWEGEEFPLNIPAFATITQVKSIIWQQGRIAIPPNRQELCLNNPDNKVWLRNEMTVQQYGISAGTVLHVLKSIYVIIGMPPDNVVQHFTVPEDITVGTLKDQLGRQGIDIENKALEMMYNGKSVVLDDRTHLWAAGLEDGTALSLFTH